MRDSQEIVPTPPGPAQRSGPAAWLVWLVAAVIAVVLGLGGGALGAWLTGAGGTRTTSAQTVPAGGSCNSVTVANEVLPTVVTINVQGSGGSGVGSGEIVRKDGYIVTNDHVIAAGANGGTITVTFADGHVENAVLVGRDPRSDIAVLRVDAAAALPVISLADSGNVVVGQPVVALGAPLGLSSTVTAGIVSALGRDVPVPSDEGTTVLAGAIQTDAAINPGNSGGALVDCRGELIGVNTAISTVPNSDGVGGGGSVGIGFAVPVNWAMDVANELIENGSVSYAYFGAQVTPIPAAVAERWSVEDGLFVQSVDPQGSAAKAGIRAGDIITTIDGRPAARGDVLTRLMFTKKAGDTLTVIYLRDGTSHTSTVTLVADPSS
jgi:putative serine protease PepD